MTAVVSWSSMSDFARSILLVRVMMPDARGNMRQLAFDELSEQEAVQLAPILGLVPATTKTIVHHDGSTVDDARLPGSGVVLVRIRTKIEHTLVGRARRFKYPKTHRPALDGARHVCWSAETRRDQPRALAETRKQAQKK